MERERRIESLLPYARKIARENHSAMGLRPFIELEDFISEAYLATVKAVDRFDPTRGVPLAGYARASIVGHLLAVARSLDPTGRRNRRTLATAAEFTSAFIVEYGREPSQAEVEEGVPGYLAALARAQHRHHVRLDDHTPMGQPLHDVLGDGAPALDSLVATKVDIWTSVARLEPMYRELIELRYRDRLTARAIGARLGRSKAWMEVHLKRAEWALRALIAEA
jgi:RNA polymerase sigma-B factor